MKPAELRDLGTDELETRAHELDDQLFRLRMQKSMGQLEAANKIHSVRRDLARLRTIIRERQGQAESR